jgi:uncharacterized membrane protein
MHAQTLKKNSILFCILFCIALSVHLPGIKFHSLWFDETSTAYIISQPSYGHLFKALYTFEGTPPLFYIIEKSFIHFFNQPVTEFSLRILPVLYGVLSCVIVFFLFCEICDTKTAFLAFLLVAFSNFYIYLFQEARCYSLLCLMALLTLWLSIQWWKKADFKRTVALFVSVMLTIQVHYYALFWICAICFSVFCIKPKNWRLLVFLCLNAVAAGISFFSLTILFMTQFQHEVGTIRNYLTANWFVGVFYAPIKVLIGAYLFKIYKLEEITRTDMLGILPSAIVLFVAMYYLYRRFRKNAISDQEKIIVLSACAAFSLHIAFGSTIPTIHPRYMAHFLILSFGIILANVSHRRKLQLAIFFTLMVLNGIATIKYYDYSKAYIEPWRDIAQSVDNALSAGSAQPEPIIGNFAVCHTTAFYMKNKSSEIYCVPSSKTPTEYARLDMFGSTCYSPLFHYDFYPIAGHTSFIDIVKTQRRGLLLSKDKSALSMINDLKRDFGMTTDFLILNIFKTNQGDVSIIRWMYREGS